MILQTLTASSDTFVTLCAVCVSDRSGGQIALLIIVSALVSLGVANWAIKKYFTKNKQHFSRKNNL